MKRIKITLELSEDLMARIDNAAIKDGFNSRSEFLRFLIVTYLKKEHPNTSGMDFSKTKSNAEEDEFANVDCEFGIPLNVIKKLEKEAKALSTNPPTPPAP